MRCRCHGQLRGRCKSLRRYQTRFLALMMALMMCSGLGIAPFAFAEPAVVITMNDAPPKFVPDKVQIKVGQTVEWRNTGHTIHDATNKPGPLVKADQVASPPGAQPFDSGFLAPGKSFSYTFTVPGTYKYVCIPHLGDGMVGEIDVTK